ncbi:MAG: GntR family transcriptional regulator [Anaerolineae bacterium]|nr:GntR family transcriptional regulator [Anaerolineae bacterium]
MSLVKDSSVPLYLQLKDALAARIARGEWRPHERLPSERQLCEKFGVSRVTVRQALDELNRAGLVYTTPSKGTFVAEPRPSLDVRVSLAGFTEDVRHLGAVPSTVLLEASLILPWPELRTILRVGEDVEVVKVERLRLVDNVPLALHTAFLPHYLCPNLLQYNLAEESLFHILRSEYGLKLARAEESVRAVLANDRELKLLNLTHPAPVLSAERTTFLEDGRVIEHSRATYCGDWYRLRMELHAVD